MSVTYWLEEPCEHGAFLPHTWNHLVTPIEFLDESCSGGRRVQLQPVEPDNDAAMSVWQEWSGQLDPPNTMIETNRGSIDAAIGEAVLLVEVKT